MQFYVYGNIKFLKLVFHHTKNIEIKGLITFFLNSQTNCILIREKNIRNKTTIIHTFKQVHL